jgi:hypothetical protein
MPNKRNYIVPIAVVSVIFLLFHIREQRKNLGCDFRGIVENVSYGSDSIKVTIKDHVYELDSGYDFQHLIQKGDFLIKRRGSTIYRLVKYQHPRVITFDN